MSTREPKLNIAKLCKELQALQRQRAEVLKSRNMQANRLQAIIAGTLGYRSGLADKDRKRLFKEAGALIKAIMEGQDHPRAEMVRVTMLGVNAFNDLKVKFEKEMTRIAKRLPVARWVEAPEQRGFGILFLAIVIGETGDLRNYANPAKLWRRMGCAPWQFDGRTAMGATWRSGKEGKLPASEWESYGYSPRRRSIAYLIGDGIVKQNGAVADDSIVETDESGVRPGPYRQRYDEAKALARKNHPNWSDLRCHLHGMLLATKRLLRELWKAWN